MNRRDKQGFMKWAKEETHESEHREKHKQGGWIQGAVKKPGALHKSLGVPQGQKIPIKKIEKATHSSSPKLRQRANLAMTFKKMNRRSQ